VGESLKMFCNRIRSSNRGARPLLLITGTALILASISGASQEPSSCRGDACGWEEDEHGDSSTEPSHESAAVVVDWNNLGLDLVRDAERGPTISGRFQAHLNTALYSTWAAFDERATGWLVDTKARTRMSATARHRWARHPAQLRAATRDYAMSVAASQIVEHIGRTVLQQPYLEAGLGENADALYAALTQRAATLVDTYRARIALVAALESERKRKDEHAAWSLEELEGLAEAVGQHVADAIEAFAAVDGANQRNDYADTTGYVTDPWATPAPTPESPTPAWTHFPDFDPAIAGAPYPSPPVHADRPFLTINPAVEDGTTQLTRTWQSLTEWGIFPRANDGGPQVPLTPHWGKVTPFALRSGDELRLSKIVEPYEEDGETLNEEFVSQAAELVMLGGSLQHGREGSAKRRATAEYWELGDETTYPPGWWSQAAVDLIAERDLPMREALELAFATSQAVFDAGIFAWDTKYHHDSVRPFTVINQLFFGSVVADSRGDQIAVTDPRDGWRPYQLRRNYTPPFPDIPSGHSTFSNAGAAVFVELLDSNVLEAESEPFISRFSLPDGFDGDPANGNEVVQLEWQYFTQRALEAGISRLYGGIHMMEGNWRGLVVGTRIGHLSVRKTQALFAGRSTRRKRTDRRLPTLVFGTMGDDTSLGRAAGERPANRGASRMEVYGFGGDDELTARRSKRLRQVELFGGDGRDTFVIARASGTIIRDYESGELIRVATQEEDEDHSSRWNGDRDADADEDTPSDELTSRIVRGVHGPATYLRFGDEVEVRLDGAWTLEELAGSIRLE